MESSIYDKAQKIKEQIKKKERCIWEINTLLKCESVGCKIDGSLKNSYRPVEYHFHNKKDIEYILHLDRVRLEADLVLLKEEFKKL